MKTMNIKYNMKTNERGHTYYTEDIFKYRDDDTHISIPFNFLPELYQPLDKF